MVTNITSFQLGPIVTNCYLIEKDGAVLIIDPGGDPEIVTDYITTNRLRPAAIMLTHAHFDHIGAVDQLQHTFNLKVFLHEMEHDWLSDPIKNGSAGLMHQSMIVHTSPSTLTEGKMSIGEFSFRVLHTPGHSPGSVSFVFDDFVVDGDALFCQGIGRTDLFGGDIAELKNSICKNLYALPDHFTVYPGHGNASSIGEEKSNNPFFSGADCD